MLLKKTRKKFRNRLPKADINIVSLMDILTTLLFFLLIIATAVRYSTIPAASTADSFVPPDDSKPQFALQVTVLKPNSATVFLGPIGGLKVTAADALNRAIASDFKGNARVGYLRKFNAPSPQALIERIAESLILIKTSFPTETKAVVAFTDEIGYQEMTDILGTVREIRTQSKPIDLKNALGEMEKTRVLFPEILITEWAQDT